ncbi:hypothetical protein M231_01506 [Tremella mesenterica]|uniref:Rho-GAP domain-containing protein n=1 Tax=Tremella mesenterica TaxID=5217 RepID=A0A4Q1BST2_TREME|nr:hypothetical protein M231_01506 [Tremella mesenterica]
MVSTRPPPAPPQGRVAYPSVTNYVAGDHATSPDYHGSSAPMTKVKSNNSSDHERSQGLKSWWKGFRDRSGSSGSEAKVTDDRLVFGVPLHESIRYAAVQISTAGPDGSLYVWGVIPIVVAKCGLYLKENATEVEGVFRISGSAKRMRELQQIFDTGPKYGKNIDWKSLPFSPHDVATIFRRFLTQMPESIIPNDYYKDFRTVAASNLSPEVSIKSYRRLIRSLPPVNQFLLLYVLDLLSVIAKKSDKNLMTAANLALIFQPGIISHPAHQMYPSEHVLSQQVVEFLIDHQDNFLIGMQLKPRKKKKRVNGNSRSSNKPQPVKADEDLMLPSDSDDEAPEGGYYVIEKSQRTTVPKPSSPTISPHLPSMEAMLLPPKPPKVPRPNQSRLMDLSSSDEEASGSYEVRSNDFSKTRTALLSRQDPKPSYPRNPSPVTVSRRRTMPTKRNGTLATRAQRIVKEAP